MSDCRPGHSSFRNKVPDVMSIGEYAGAVELSVSAVRFYADRGLLAPASTDPTTGYRYYTDEQVPRGSMIRDLRLMDMALTEIEGVLELAPDARNAAIQRHVRRLENRLTGVRGVARTLGAASGTEPGTATTLRSADLARAIGQVTAAAGCDARQPHHMCVLIEVRDNSLRFAATDSHRLAVRDLVPSTIGATFSAVVAAVEIGSWPVALAAGDDVTMGHVDGTLTVSRHGLDLRCPTIPLDFPDYETILATSTNVATTVVAKRRQLMSLLESFDGDGTIALTTSATELVAARDGIVRRMAAEVSGAHAQVAINPRFATDAVEQAVGTELIIEIDDALHPLTFRSADDGTYTSMLMPVRLDWPR